MADGPLDPYGDLLDPFAARPDVAEIPRRGFMTGIELTGYPPDLKIGHRVTLEARRRGAIVRPLGDVVVLMPPLSISEADLRRLVDITAAAIEGASVDVEADVSVTQA